MNKLYVLLLIFVSAELQAQWYWMADMPPAVSVVQYHTTNSPVVIGRVGRYIILFSSDKGVSWQTKSLPTQGYTRGAHFFNKDTGYVTIDGYVLGKTIDGGNTWSTSTPFPNVAMFELTFAEDSVGYILSNNGNILKSTDGGNTWTQKPTPAADYIYAPQFLTKNFGIIKENIPVKFHLTTDGAETWRTLNHPTSEQVSRIIMFSDSLFIGFSATRVYISTDKGLTWTLRSTVPSYILSAHFNNSQQGVLHLSQNRLLITTDGAQSFVTKQLPEYNGTMTIFNALSISDYYFSTSWGALYATSDTGNTWVTSGASYNFQWNAVISGKVDEVATLVGNGGRIFRINYQSIYSAGSPTIKNLRAISAWGALRGLIAGDDGTIVRASSQTGGWVGSSSGVTVDLYGVKLSSASDLGFAVGDSGTIIKTTNAGVTWQQLVSGSQLKLRDVALIGDSVVIAVGDSGVILKSSNAGLSWVRIQVGAAFNFLSVSSYLQNLLAVGENGQCYRSNNYGSFWFPGSIPETSNLNSVSHWENNTAALVTESGNLYHTTNNGQSWSFQRSFPQTGLTGVSYYNSFTANITLRNGFVLRRTSLVPVELTSFSTVFNGSQVLLKWATASELNNRGFEIQKSGNKSNWNTIGFMNGRGTTTALSEYSFTDHHVDAGTWYYRLIQIDHDGTQKIYEDAEVTVQPDFSLAQNFPNPFNPETTIEYTLPAPVHTSLVLYDILGNQLEILDSGYKQAGKHYFTLRRPDLASGIYYYKLTAGTISVIRKMMVIK